MKTVGFNIALLVLSPFEQLNLIGPSSAFSFARHAGKPVYQTHLLSATNEGSVHSSNGLTIGPATHYAKFDRSIDTLLVIGGEGAMIAPDKRLRTWLTEKSRRVRRIGAICTGAFLLAEAGILDKRRVVTHWRYCDLLAKQYPGVQVERDPFFLKDGKVYTTAGVSAGVDLALALIEEDLGHDAVIAVSRELMLYPRRSGGQAQFVEGAGQQQPITEAAFLHLRSWVIANITADLSVRNLARIASMSERTFARRFSEQFYMAPAEWVQWIRVEAARRHLEGGELTLNEIAHKTGFRDVVALRKTFSAHFLTTPGAYQERFQRFPAYGENESHLDSLRRTGTHG